MNKQKFSLTHKMRSLHLKNSLKKSIKCLFAYVPFSLGSIILNLCYRWHRRTHNIMYHVTGSTYLSIFRASYVYLEDICKTLKAIGKIQLVSELAIFQNL